MKKILGLPLEHQTARLGKAYGENDPVYFDKPKFFMPQLDWITGEDGQVLVNMICRFENMQDDFAMVCRTLGLDVRLPHQKKSTHVPIIRAITMLTPETLSQAGIGRISSFSGMVSE